MGNDIDYISVVGSGEGTGRDLALHCTEQYTNLTIVGAFKL